MVDRFLRSIAPCNGPAKDSVGSYGSARRSLGKSWQEDVCPDVQSQENIHFPWDVELVISQVLVLDVREIPYSLCWTLWISSGDCRHGCCCDLL